MSPESEPAAGRHGADVSAGDPRDYDTGVAHSARVHDYWLGGKDNYAADRAAGDAVIAAYPGIVESVRANRAFLARAVRFLAAEAGIRQFLDIGTGIPAANNTHEVAQSQAPGCRVVYVDYDPVVLVHVRALLASRSDGAIDYIDADLRDQQTIVRHAMAAVPSGSYQALSQVASDIEAEQMAEAARRYNRLAHEKQSHRSHAEVARFFDGLELVEPGLVPVQEWRPRSMIEASTRSAMWGGVGYKP
jgi:S-adenosyl methyltransferase